MLNQFWVIIIMALFFSSCNQQAEEAAAVDTTEEIIQQIGDALVSVDESGGSTNGGIAKINTTGYEKSFARLSPNDQSWSISNLWIPKSYAANCSTIPYVCSGTGSASRTFSECSLMGNGKVSGSVTLTYTGSGVSNCTIPATNDRVNRSPDYQITGLRGAVFKVVALTAGQSLTRAVGANVFSFTNTGIRRTYTTSNGTTVLDMTSLTTSPISVIGATRNARSITGGGLTIINNLTSVSCTISHSNVSWTSGCNCPTAGTWTVSCPDKTFSVNFGTTCGEATYLRDSISTIVTMDRCQP